MRKLIGLAVVVSSLALASSAAAHCGVCGIGEPKDGKAAAAGAKKDHGCPHHGCASCVDGAETKVTNTADGVTIAITSKDAATVKKIQDAGAKMAAGGGKHEHGHEGAEKKGAKKKG